MRLRLFDDIEARLSRVRLVDNKVIYHRPQRDPDAKMPGTPAVNHVGLWNENTTRLTQLRPFAPPAVFIEFYPVTWGELGRDAVRGDMVIRLHIVTSTLAQTDTPYRDEALQRFRLIRAIKAAFVGFAGKADKHGRSYSRFKYYGSSTDHNHEQICEDLEEWQTHCIDCSATIDNGYILTPHNVTLDMGDSDTGARGRDMA